MNYPGVMIEYNSNKGDISSCSGVLICDNYILTHGSLFYSLLKDKYNLSDIDLSSEVLSDHFFDLISNGNYLAYIENDNVNLRSSWNDGISFDDSNSIATKSTIHSFNEDDKKHSKFKSYIAYPELLFVSKVLSKEIIEDFTTSAEIKFLTESFSCMNFEANILSSFLVLRIGNPDCLLECLEKRSNQACIPKKGDMLIIDSCPFGNVSPAMFLSSFTTGIVSNCNYSGNLFITDARCLMGGEGAPIYNKCSESFKLCGFVLAPFCWLNGEWLGLTLAVSAKTVLDAIINVLINHDVEGRKCEANYNGNKNVDILWKNIKGSYVLPTLPKNFPNRNLHNEAYSNFLNEKLCDNLYRDYINRINYSTIGIICGDDSGAYDWGSGVIVDAKKGLIITCSHVIQKAMNKNVTILKSNGKKCMGKVLFKTFPQHIMSEEHFLGKMGHYDLWDLAIVLSEDSFETYLPLADNIPSKGSSILHSGFGLFNIKSSTFSSNISSGVISKINFVSEEGLNIKLLKGPSINSSRKRRHVHFKNTLSEIKEAEMNISRHPSFLKQNHLIPDKFWIHETWDGNKFLAAFQTSCSVYKGNSGGPVIAIHRTKGPLVIGIMVCCISNKDSQGTFPQVNMAVPSCGIVDAVEKFSISGDIQDLSPLCIKSKNSNLLWSHKVEERSKL